MVPNNKEDTRKQSLIITAITLFALSGLLVGFAVGAVTRPHRSTPTTTKQNTPPVVNQQPQSATPTQTNTTQVVGLGYPVMQGTPNETADGTTTYTLSAHPVDQSIDKGHGKEVHASGITCKAWLTKNPDVTDALMSHRDRLLNVDTLSQPMPQEEQDALNFVGTSQTQQCNPNGDTIWKYQISPSIKQGTYYLVVLTDWAGQRYNWSWMNIAIQKAGD